MINKAKLLRTVRLWHRRLSLSILIWIMFVAVSGIVLNHSSDFGLDKLSMPSPVLKKVYKQAPPDVTSYYLKNRWISLVGEEQLFQNLEELGICRQLVGVSAYQQELFIACPDALYILNNEGELLEQMGELHGLPVPLSEFGSCSGLPCLKSQDKFFELDPISYSWSSSQHTELNPTAPTPAPKGLKASLRKLNTPPEFNLERFIRDLHSGVIFGLGPWLMDIFALLLISVSLLGFTLWWKSRR